MARKTKLVPWAIHKRSGRQSFQAILPDGESIELTPYPEAGPILSPERKTVSVELVPWLITKGGLRTFLAIERKRTRELVEIPGARKHLHHATKG